MFHWRISSQANSDRALLLLLLLVSLVKQFFLRLGAALHTGDAVICNKEFSKKKLIQTSHYNYFLITIHTFCSSVHFRVIQLAVLQETGRKSNSTQGDKIKSTGSSKKNQFYHRNVKSWVLWEMVNHIYKVMVTKGLLIFLSYCFNW